MNDNEQEIIPERRLGAFPAKVSMKALQLADFTTTETIVLPKATDFWKKRKKFAYRTYGNTEFGCCTRSKQAIAAINILRLGQSLKDATYSVG